MLHGNDFIERARLLHNAWRGVKLRWFDWGQLNSDEKEAWYRVEELSTKRVIEAIQHLMFEKDE